MAQDDSLSKTTQRALIGAGVAAAFHGSRTSSKLHLLTWWRTPVRQTCIGRRSNRVAGWS